MQPATERYGRLRELFHLLVDLGPEEREQRLAALGANDADLVTALRELLAVGGEADEALAGAVGEEAKSLWQEGGAWVGRRIGPWQVVRLIGHGGMGSVFLARRADGAFTQQVALKLIRSGFASAHLVRRFHAERRVLAALDHPNIARLLDGGSIGDGQPYLVMEHVDGVDVEAHCEAGQLSLAERLELFRAVCAAVEHAHRSLIVHRDLKPSNVMVTAGGIPKLLDFGIAKLLAGDPDDETRPLTLAAAGTFGTIAFASPEQLRGEAVTTATDVYSLGVILYRLLTGTHPYPLGQLPITEAARIVCEVEPVPPSRAVLAGGDGAEARRRSRELRGDLDNVVLMALRKEPARRYPSVAAFADDLRRYSDGLPVVARYPSRRYRARKFVQRHRVAVAAAILVVLSLVAGLAGTLWSARRAREAARRAEIERAKATQVSDFLANMFSAANVGWRVRGNRGASLAEVLAGASDRLGRELRDQPEVEARLRHVLGESQAVLLDYGQATRQLERALALDLRLYGEQDLRTARARALLGWVRGNAGDFARGAALLDAAIATYRRHPDPPPADLVEALGMRGYVAAIEGRLPLAETLARESVALARARLPNHLLLPAALGGLGVVQSNRGDIAGAERTYREALRLFARLPEPDVPERRAALLYLGSILSSRHQLDEAEPLLREALAVTERHLGEDDVLAVEPHFELGLLLARRGDDAGAEEELRTGLDIQRRHTADSHPMVGLGEVYLGRVLTRQGRHAEAERTLRRGFDNLERYPGLRLRRSQAATALAACLAAQGRFAEAEPLALAAYEHVLAAQGAGAASTEQAVRDLVQLYEAWGKGSQAASWSARLPAGR